MLGTPVAKDAQPTEEERADLVAYDCLNGLTYIGHSAKGFKGETLVNYIIIPTEELRTDTRGFGKTALERYASASAKTDTLVYLCNNIALHKLKERVSQA